MNAQISDALSRVRQVPEIVSSTGAYNVWRPGPNPKARNEAWQASQTLELHAHDGTALLRIVGELQQRELAVGQLAWQLAPETARRARQEATTAAVKALRSRAEDAAALIGLQFNSFREVRLDNPRPPIMPRGFATSAMAATEPNAEAGDITVSATVEADVILKPR